MVSYTCCQKKFNSNLKIYASETEFVSETTEVQTINDEDPNWVTEIITEGQNNQEDSQLTELEKEVVTMSEEQVEDILIEETQGDSNVTFSDEGVTIDGVFYTSEEFDKILETMEDPEQLNIDLTEVPAVQSSAFAIPMTYWATSYLYAVPGVGQAALMVTGGIIFAGAIVYGGHWTYGRIRTHINSRPKPKSTTSVKYTKQVTVTKTKYISYTYGIPERLLDSAGNVKLNGFTQKVPGKTVKYRNPKTGWVIEKDTAGHAGKKWKVKDKGNNRKASTDGNGKIISK